MIPEPELAHHRLSLIEQGGWWRPLATLTIAVVGYLACVMALITAATIVGEFLPEVDRRMETLFAEAETINPVDPLTTAVQLLTVALMLPVACLAVRITGRRGRLSSVDTHIRWRLLIESLVPATLVVVLAFVASCMADPAQSTGFRHPGTLGVLVVVGLVPLQDAAEEYIFRGLIPQTVGHWLRCPAWGIAVSVPLFTAGHGYGWPGLTAITVFAIAAGFIVWRTGGLEVVIAWHTINNLVALPSTAATAGTADQNEITWQLAVVNCISCALMIGLVEIC